MFFIIRCAFFLNKCLKLNKFVSLTRNILFSEAFDRELEELRRADEEAARRRLIGLANRGLPMINHHGSRYNQQQYNLHHQSNCNYHQNHIKFVESSRMLIKI